VAARGIHPTPVGFTPPPWGLVAARGAGGRPWSPFTPPPGGRPSDTRFARCAPEEPVECVWTRWEDGSHGCEALEWKKKALRARFPAEIGWLLVSASSQCQHDRHDQESYTSEEIGADGYEAGGASAELQSNE
jgi:hypothetical protein